MQQSDATVVQEAAKAPTQPDEPPKRAIIAWRLRWFGGYTDQTEIAKVMTEQGEPATQGSVSRWLQQVENYQQAGGKITPPEMDRAVSVNPAAIDMGERLDHRTPHQRERWGADSSQE